MSLFSKLVLSAFTVEKAPEKAVDGLDVTRDLLSKQAAPNALARRRYDSWMNHPVIAGGYINKKFGGDATHNWLNYFATHYPGACARAVSLGCGSGGLERHAHSLSIAQHFDAYDIAPGAIDVARVRRQSIWDRLGRDLAEC